MLVNSTTVNLYFGGRLFKSMCHSTKINRSGCFIMDLLPSHWLRSVFSIQRSVVFASSILLVACAVAPAQSIEPAPQEVASAEVVEPKKQPDLPLSAELVYDILTAEIAGQRGEIGIAAELYNNAANIVDSPAVAARSTQIANFTRNQPRINRALERWIEVDPNDADIYIMQVPFLLLKGDYAMVVKDVNTALSLAPEQSGVYLARVSDNLIELAQQEQALSVIEELKAFQNNDPEVIFVYARMQAFYKNYDTALLNVDKVLKNDAKRDDALILKAEILQRMGKGTSAMALLKKPATSDDASENMQFAYAKLLGENNKTEEAREIFLQLNADAPENEEVIFALGLIAIQGQDGQEAKHYFNQLIAMGDNGKQAAYFMGLAEQINHNNEAAMVWFDSVPVDSPRFEAAQSSYINLLADDGQMDKARLHLQLLRAEQPKNALQYYLFEASFLRERNQDQAAFDLYTEALQQFPGQTELLYGRAMVAERLNRLSILEDDLRAILKKEPNNSQALNALGYTLTDRTDRHQEALALISKAVEISPNDAFYLDSLAWAHYRLGHLDLAEKYIKQAVAIQSDAEFLAHLGEILWQRGKKVEAKKAWDDGLKKDPNNTLLRKTMSRFGQ
ncbi:MAG TPA: tetratricopeptide repeat protein [Methylophaga sp.]|nr:tetratricopeptide repeat protein [Methylophaga sp.]HEC58648.1 tetratricopeptide repeat protein [Methylophaga sp.]